MSKEIIKIKLNVIFNDLYHDREPKSEILLKLNSLINYIDTVMPGDLYDFRQVSKK